MAAKARKKILVADDTELFRELGSIFLARLGTVLTASSGSEALEIARREQPQVMIVDFEMPDMCGDNLCRAVKADRDLHRTPVILVTSGRCAEDHARAVRAQADDVLMKPLNRIQLGLSVSRLLGDDRHLAPARVPFDEDVRVRLVRADASSWGVVRDLSRGGVFVESLGRLRSTRNSISTSGFRKCASRCGRPRRSCGRVCIRKAAHRVWAFAFWRWTGPAPS